MPIGSIGQEVIDFLVANSVAFLTVVITLAGVVGTPYYVRNKIDSAQQERYNQAKDELIDSLENQVVNDREITTERYDNLQSAIERKYSVSISERVSISDVLQDLLLRIERSNLDVEDKVSYSEAIETKIDNFEQERRLEDLPDEYRIAVQKLAAFNDVSADDLVAEVEEARQAHRTKSSSGLLGGSTLPSFSRVLDELPASVWMRLVIAAIIYMYALYSLLQYM